MSSQIVANDRYNAKIYSGEALCRQKSHQLLEEMSLPKGLFPSDDLVEFGYNQTTGFMWLKQKKSKEHKFRRISRTVWYDTEVTAFVEDRRMKRVTGVKGKELFIWVSIADIYINNTSSGKITFANSTGSLSFPVSAFDLEDESAGK